MGTLYDAVLNDARARRYVDPAMVVQEQARYLDGRVRGPAAGAEVEMLGEVVLFNLSDVAVSYLEKWGSLPTPGPDELGPSLVPPYRSCWAEYRLPDSLRHPMMAGKIGTVGVLVATADSFASNGRLTGDARRIQELANMAAHSALSSYKNRGVFINMENGARREYLPDLDRDNRWVVHYRLFMRWRGRPHPICDFTQFLGADGLPNTMDGDIAQVASLTLEGHEGMTQEDSDRTIFLSSAQLHPVMFAWGLTHCKNVEVVRDPPADDRFRRAYRRRHGREHREYHTLRLILPSGPTRLGRKGTGDGVPWHTVRGHFATYGKDGRGLLFGRLAGTFWVPDHVRGKKELGEVEKGYELVVAR